MDVSCIYEVLEWYLKDCKRKQEWQNESRKYKKNRMRIIQDRKEQKTIGD